MFMSFVSYILFVFGLIIFVIMFIGALHQKDDEVKDWQALSIPFFLVFASAVAHYIGS